MRADVHNPDTLVPAEVESGFWNSQVKSGQSRLIRNGWIFCKGFKRVLGHAPPEKKLEICGLQTAGYVLKLSILSPPRYFCIILNLLRSHQADHFGSWGGGGGRGAYAPRALLCLQACINLCTLKPIEY